MRGGGGATGRLTPTLRVALRVHFSGVSSSFDGGFARFSFLASPGPRAAATSSKVSDTARLGGAPFPRVRRLRATMVESGESSVTSASLAQASTCRVGIVSDTHGVYDPEVSAHFARLGGVDVVVHAGDVGHHGGHREVLERLRGDHPGRPVEAIRGNVDDIEDALLTLPEELILTLAGHRVLVTHERPAAKRLVTLGDGTRSFDVVVCGHSHKAETATVEGGALLVNPGSAGPARFSLPRTCATLTLTKGVTPVPKHVTTVRLAKKAPPKVTARDPLSHAGGTGRVGGKKRRRNATAGVDITGGEVGRGDDENVVGDGCTWEEIVAASKIFVYPHMPTTANRLSALTCPLERSQAADHARGVRVVISASTYHLLDDFISIKRPGTSSSGPGSNCLGSDNPQGLSNPECRLYGGDSYRPDDGSDEWEGGGNRGAVTALVRRLLTARPLVFMNPEDNYVLRDGAGQGVGGFDNVGTDREKYPLTLDRTLSYDEMALAALLAVAVPTHFINPGDRFNEAVPRPAVNIGSDSSNGNEWVRRTRGVAGTSEGNAQGPLQYDFTRRGVYVGQVGARFERRGVMEAAHMLVDPEVNTSANGYGPSPTGGRHKDLLRAWARAYSAPGGYLPTWDEALAEAKANSGQGRFLPVPPPRASPPGLPPVGDRPVFLDTVIYRERVAVCVETLLAEAESRGRETTKGPWERDGEQGGVYVHVVGLGLGVWQVTDEQYSLSLDTWVRAMRTRLRLKHVTDVNFSWWGKYSDDACSETHTWQGLPTSGVLTGEPGTPAEFNRINVHFSRRSPADPIPPGKILVASYAWDGNAYPGNEYWKGSLSGSGDPAAACCSHICELQNPLVNPRLGAEGNNWGNPMKNGGLVGSLHVALSNGSLVPLLTLPRSDTEHREFHGTSGEQH